MLNQKELTSLKKGDIVDHFLIVKKCELRLTKNNKQYVFLEVGDKTVALNANVWENFDSVYTSINTGTILKVTGSIDDYQGTPQIKVSTIRTLLPSENLSPKDFMAKSLRDLKEMQNEFNNRINKISNTHLKILIKQIFKGKNFDKFLTAPAGKAWHHSYIHGLLEHTLEIIKICDLMCDIHHELNRDLLICGAMLHDFGKIDELSYDVAFDYTDKGKLLGHIVISAMIINEEIKNIPNFPEELKNSLIHLILSHQGKLEHASPVEPKLLEAIALYHADELSAKTNAYKLAIKAEENKNTRWTKFLPLANTSLYIPLKEDSEKISNTLFD